MVAFLIDVVTIRAILVDVVICYGGIALFDASMFFKGVTKQKRVVRRNRVISKLNSFWVSANIKTL